LDGEFLIQLALLPFSFCKARVALQWLPTDGRNIAILSTESELLIELGLPVQLMIFKCAIAVSGQCRKACSHVSSQSAHRQLSF
jgi:hypothetical protein